MFGCGGVTAICVSIDHLLQKTAPAYGGACEHSLWDARVMSPVFNDLAQPQNVDFGTFGSSLRSPAHFHSHSTRQRLIPTARLGGILCDISAHYNITSFTFGKVEAGSCRLPLDFIGTSRWPLSGTQLNTSRSVALTTVLVLSNAVRYPLPRLRDS